MWSVVVKVFQQILAHGLLFGGIWFIVESNRLHDAQGAIEVISYAIVTFGTFLLLWAGLVTVALPWLMPWWMIQVHREENVYDARSIGLGFIVIGFLMVSISMMLLPFAGSWAPSRHQGGPFIYIFALLGVFCFACFANIFISIFPGVMCFRISRAGVYQGPIDGSGMLITLQNFEKVAFTRSRSLIKELYIYGEGSVEVQKRWGKKKVVERKFDRIYVTRNLMGGLSSQEIEDFILRLKEEEQAQVAGSS